MSLLKNNPQELPREILGSGVTAEVDEVKVVVGNEHYLRDANVQNLATLMADVETISNAQSCTFVGLNGRYAGFIAFSDPVRDDANKEIRPLGSQGYAIYMVSSYRQSLYFNLLTLH
jgi:Cu+-exporting ATPase